ncbi:MAG: hypothetical protein M3O30_16520 [Planctomycetota bacterium]|nr:hypothetical protein [Planctomycetota bacterium]
MRELEFLPAWYPTLRRKRRLVVVELWCCAAVFAFLGTWMIRADHQLHVKAHDLNVKYTRLNETKTVLREIGELESVKRQLSQQAEVVARLGPYISTSKIIDVLDQTMPADMALLDLHIDSETRQRDVSALTLASGGVSPLSRRLVVRMHGVVPSDVDLGDFVARLSSVPHFSDAAPLYSKDRVESGHLMREFEVDCAISLNEGQ